MSVAPSKPLLLFFLMGLGAVEEIRYEKIKPRFDATTLDECKELRFHVPANSDYFTRCAGFSFARFISPSPPPCELFRSFYSHTHRSVSRPMCTWWWTVR